MEIRAVAFWLFIIPVFLFSQEHKPYIGMNTGISIPLGKYSGKELHEGSFALPGWNLGLEGGYFFKNGMGIGLEAGYYAHPVDVAGLAEAKLADDPFLEELTIRSDPYRALTLLDFVQYTFKIARDFHIIPKAGAGIVYGLSPYQLNKASYFLVGTRWFEITSTRDWAGYYMAGASFRYGLNSCIGLMLNAEFSYGVLKYRFLTGTGNIREDVHHMMVVDVLAGVVITLFPSEN